MHPHRQQLIRDLFDNYMRLYAARDPRLLDLFSNDFSGFTGGGDFLVHDRQAWSDITLQDFAQVPQPIRMELLDLAVQDLGQELVTSTAFFHIHLPVPDHTLAREVARLVLIFRLEGTAWKIVHSSISIPYPLVRDGEVYPLASLQERNSALEAEVRIRTRELRESEALHRQLTEDTLDVIWKADRHMYVTYVSPADERLRGFKADEVVGRHVFEFFTAQGVATVKDLMRRRQLQDPMPDHFGFIRFEAQHRCKDGQVRWGEVMSKVELDDQGTITGYHGITREITARKLLEQQVLQLALHDALTDLPNRRLLLDRLSHAMAASQRSGRCGALLFLDLDNFKSLNDRHGHEVGDALLLQAAARLKRCVRQADTVARFGGDEFVLLLTDLGHEPTRCAAQALAVAQKVLLALSHPYQLTLQHGDGQCSEVQHLCTASIGMCLFGGNEASTTDVLRWADAAMYQAKDAGRNTVRMHGTNEAG